MAARRPSPRRPAAVRLRRPGGARGGGPASRSAPPSTGWRPRARRPSSSSRSTDRSARTAPSRRCSRRPGVAYTGSGVAASAIGMDKTLFKRMCRGIGLPVVDWREIRADALGHGPRRGPRGAGGLRRRRAGPAADGQAGAPRELGRDDPRPRPLRARRGARGGLPPRHARPRRDLPGRRARPRGRRHRQRRAARDLRPGRDRVRPRVLRLRGQVHGRPVRDVHPGRGDRRPAGDCSGRSPATPTG